MASALHPAVSTLLCALSDSIGEPVLFDTHGECILEFDAAVELVIAQTTHPHIVSLRSAVMPAGHPPDSGLLEAALSLNYTRVPPGYAIALDAASKQLVLVALVDANAVAPQDFQQMVAGFLELVPGLRAGFDELRAGDGPHVLVGAGTLA